MKKTLIIDVDYVICTDGFLELINEFLKTSYTYDDVDIYYLQELVPEDQTDAWWSFFLSKNQYDYAKLIEGAREGVKKLYEKYDMYICSSCVLKDIASGSADSFKNKFNFLTKHFPFFDPKRFIFTSSKYLIKADIMIDDKLTNLLGDNVPHKYMFKAYHNHNFTDEELSAHNIKRISGWQEIEDILL